MLNNANYIFILIGTNRFNTLDADGQDACYLSSLCKKIIANELNLTNKESE